jgi:hypothetical protein
MEINIYFMVAILGGFITIGVLGLMIRWMFSKITREDVVTKTECASSRQNCATFKQKSDLELSEAVSRQFKLRDELPKEYVKRVDYALELERLDASRKEDNTRIDIRLASIEEKVDALLQRRTRIQRKAKVTKSRR